MYPYIVLVLFLSTASSSEIRYAYMYIISGACGDCMFSAYMYIISRACGDCRFSAYMYIISRACGDCRFSHHNKCEELVLETTASRDQDSKQGSYGRKPSILATELSRYPYIIDINWTLFYRGDNTHRCCKIDTLRSSTMYSTVSIQVMKSTVKVEHGKTRFRVNLIPKL